MPQGPGRGGKKTREENQWKMLVWIIQILQPKRESYPELYIYI